MRGVLISSNLKGREVFFLQVWGGVSFTKISKEWSVITPLKFMSLQRTCDLDFLYANLIPISKSHTMHLMDYM